MVILLLQVSCTRDTQRPFHPPPGTEGPAFRGTTPLRRHASPDTRLALSSHPVTGEPVPLYRMPGRLSPGQTSAAVTPGDVRQHISVGGFQPVAIPSLAEPLLPTLPATTGIMQAAVTLLFILYSRWPGPAIAVHQTCGYAWQGTARTHRLTTVYPAVRSACGAVVGLRWGVRRRNGAERQRLPERAQPQLSAVPSRRTSE